MAVAWEKDEEMFMRAALADDAPGYVDKRSVKAWLGRSFATVDRQRAVMAEAKELLEDVYEILGGSTFGFKSRIKQVIRKMEENL